MHYLTPFVVGYTDRADIHHGGMFHEFTVDLLRVNVHPTGNDEFSGAPREEQVPVLVEVTHVSQGEIVAAIRILRLRSIFEILETPGLWRTHIDGTDFSWCDLGTLIVQNLVSKIRSWPADSAGFGQPFFGTHHETTATFCGGVIFPDDGAEPFNHRLLDVYGAGCGSVNEVTQRGDVVFCFHFIRQMQQTVEHGCDHVGMGDLVLVDQPQGLLGIPLVHHEDPNTGNERLDDVDSKWCSVISGTGNQVQVSRLIVR